jgi:hypothetical protein
MIRQVVDLNWVCIDILLYLIVSSLEVAAFFYAIFLFLYDYNYLQYAREKPDSTYLIMHDFWQKSTSFNLSLPNREWCGARFIDF